MKLQTSTAACKRGGFTLIELLTVIAIIAILAAILLPVFGVVREQSRQSATISNMHDVYMGVRQFYDDEGYYPSTLFPYAEKVDAGTGLRTPVVAVGDPGVVPMDKATGKYTSTAAAYIFPEHSNTITSFTSPDNLETDKQGYTQALYPESIPVVTAQAAGNPMKGGGGQPAKWFLTPGGSNQGDPEAQPAFNTATKYWYKMDSMDIGPKIKSDGRALTDASGNYIYEVHYAPDWTHVFGKADDFVNAGEPLVTQLKYKYPPADTTVITYITDHVATAGSAKVIVLLASGSTRKVDYHTAVGPGASLPIIFKP